MLAWASHAALASCSWSCCYNQPTVVRSEPQLQCLAVDVSGSRARQIASHLEQNSNKIVTAVAIVIVVGHSSPACPGQSWALYMRGRRWLVGARGHSVVHEYQRRFTDVTAATPTRARTIAAVRATASPTVWQTVGIDLPPGGSGGMGRRTLQVGTACTVSISGWWFAVCVRVASTCTTLKQRVGQ